MSEVSLATHRFRDDLLLWLSDLKGNPAVTQRERETIERREAK